MHQLFDEVIGTPPPTSIDPRAIVRRDRRTRATMWSTLGATAVAAGLATVVFTSATTPAGTPPVSAPAESSVAPAPDNRLELRSATREEAQVSAGQLKTALDAAVRAAVPAATWDAKGFDITVIDYVTPMGWIGGTGVTIGGAPGDVRIMLHGYPATADIDPLTCAALAAVPGKERDQKRDPKSPPAPTCVDARTPSGKPVVTYTTDREDLKAFEVRIGLADNRVMTIGTGGGEHAGPPVLSLDQLVVIAQQATDRVK